MAKKLMLLSRTLSRSLSGFLPLIKMLSSAEEAMSEIYGAEYVSLHVRKSNKAAIGLYRDTLGFEVAKVEKKYCASPTFCSLRKAFQSLTIVVDGDGEDALSMKLVMKQ